MTMRTCEECGTITELLLCPLCEEEAQYDFFDEYHLNTDQWNEDDWDVLTDYEKQMNHDDG